MAHLYSLIRNTPGPVTAHLYPPQEYVRGRIRQFARDFAKEIAPTLTPEAIDDTTNRVLGATEPSALMALAPAAPGLQAGQGQYRLEFRHECA